MSLTRLGSLAATNLVLGGNVGTEGDAYKNYPHQHYGLPSEYSRGTGLSFQIFMYLEKK